MEFGIFATSATSQILSYVTGLVGFKRISKALDLISYAILSVVGVELAAMTLVSIYFGFSQNI